MSSINELITKFHNPSLVKPDESPNGNRILMIWNDGEVTDTKGGHAFLKRSLFTQSYEGHYLSSIADANITMPCPYSDTKSYAIIETLSQAMEIRNMMTR